MHGEARDSDMLKSEDWTARRSLMIILRRYFLSHFSGRQRPFTSSGSLKVKRSAVGCRGGVKLRDGIRSPVQPTMGCGCVVSVLHSQYRVRRWQFANWTLNLAHLNITEHFWNRIRVGALSFPRFNNTACNSWRRLKDRLRCVYDVYCIT